MKELQKKIQSLLNNDLVVAFSGGVDSSVLLKIACQEAKKLDKQVYAVTFETKLHPACDIDNAIKVAKEAGAIHKICKVNELDSIDIKFNPVDRCYRCKHYLFSTLKELANSLNITTIIDGTNFDDLNEYRPGLKALKELEIISPLAELSITKSQVREIAKSLNLSVSTRPSAPCLATRLPYGKEIDFVLLENIDKGEEYLKSIGFLVNRIRVHDDIARIEIKKEDFTKFLENNDNIISKLKELGFIYITLDLEAFRSGSMDIYVKNNN